MDLFNIAIFSHRQAGGKAVFGKNLYVKGKWKGDNLGKGKEVLVLPRMAPSDLFLPLTNHVALGRSLTPL